MSTTLLLSIHPKYVDSMRKGQKVYELRKVRPRDNVHHILIYETAPTSALVGAASVNGVVSGSRLWVREQTRLHDGVTDDEFLSYFSDPDRPANAICLDEFRWLPTPKELKSPFSPPQSYFYLNDAQVLYLVGDAIELIGKNTPATLDFRTHDFEVRDNTGEKPKRWGVQTINTVTGVVTGIEFFAPDFMPRPDTKGTDVCRFTFVAKGWTYRVNGGEWRPLGPRK